MENVSIFVFSSGPSMSGANLNVKLIKQRENSGIFPLFIEGEQMAAHVYRGVGQLEFFADIMAVVKHGVFGYRHQIGDFLVGFAFLDQVGYPDLRRREVGEFMGNAADKG